MGVHRQLRDRGNGKSRGITPTQTLPIQGEGFPNAIPLPGKRGRAYCGEGVFPRRPDALDYALH